MTDAHRESLMKLNREIAAHGVRAHTPDDLFLTAAIAFLLELHSAGHAHRASSALSNLKDEVCR